MDPKLRVARAYYKKMKLTKEEEDQAEGRTVFLTDLGFLIDPKMGTRNIMEIKGSQHDFHITHQQISL